MGIKIGMVGLGVFAHYFIPLFIAHPLVDEVVLCDVDEEKVKESVKRYGITNTSPSLEHLCRTDVDAVVIITQNWMHGPQAQLALREGKHVYSAVPIAISIEEIEGIVKLVEETGNIYMMGETSYYYPDTIYCRNQFKNKLFGDVIYAQSEYIHDFDHGLYDVYKLRGGYQWLEIAGSPPMYYPTHSISQVLSVTGAHITHVSCYGFKDTWNDGVFDPHNNIWKNTFSNETALFKLSDGGCCRINEFRRAGHPGSIHLSMYGTQGSFEMNHAGAVWLTRNSEEKTHVDDLLKCSPEKHLGDMDMVVSEDGTHSGTAPIHDVSRLPKEFKGLPNGHNGSHQFLVDDFILACVEKKAPPNNVWDAARYTIPGIIAHESALKNGVLLSVPDFGDPKY